LRKSFKEEKEDEVISFKYVGQAFNLFLIAEKDNELYLVDQHAAHERIIYDELLEQKTVQNLLIPIKVEVDKLTDEFLSEYSYIYTKLGIMLARVDDGIWEITALPAVARSIESQIVSYIESAKADEHELEMNLFAIIACKAAIKAGDIVDKWSAEALLEKVFKLKEPCCPHGRTFLVKLKEKELRAMVGRTI
jgi:DNA mismatch repair protein MutL